MLLNINNHTPSHLAAKDSNGDTITYGELSSIMSHAKTSINERSLIFILCHNHIGTLAWVLSAIESKAVPLLLNANMDSDLLHNLIDIYKPRYICLHDNDSLLGKSDFTIVDQRLLYTLYETNNEVYQLNPDLAYLLPTSGSTGSPKLVRHSYKNIASAAENISAFFELKPNDKPLVVLPIYYTMGLSVVFSHIYAGATLLLTDQSMASPEFWKFFKEENATSFTGVPYSFEVLKMLRFMRMDMPSLDLLTQGGGKLPSKLNLEFAEYCQKNSKRWIATYGQTEGSARMAYLPAEFAISKLGSIGKAIPNAELFLIDENDNRITSPNVNGEMCFKGNGVTLGYAQSLDDLMRGDDRNGQLKTGDIAYFDEDGFFFIVGRQSRFLKLFGLRISLDECERIIKNEIEIECACTGNDEKLVVFICNENQVDEIKQLIIDKTNLMASVVSVKVINEIPKNQAGKTLYKELNYD